MQADAQARDPQAIESLLQNNQQLINAGFVLFPNEEELSAMAGMVQEGGISRLSNEQQVQIRGDLAENASFLERSRESREQQRREPRLGVVNLDELRKLGGMFGETGRAAPKRDARGDREGGYSEPPSEPDYSAPPSFLRAEAPKNQYDELPGEPAEAYGVRRPAGDVSNDNTAPTRASDTRFFDNNDNIADDDSDPPPPASGED